MAFEGIRIRYQHRSCGARGRGRATAKGSAEPAGSGQGWVVDTDDDVAAPWATGKRRRDLDADVGAGVGSVDHLSVADVDTDVGDVGGSFYGEDQVARSDWVPRSELRRDVVLLLGNAGQGDPGNLVGDLDEARAVEADAGALAAPDVGGGRAGERLTRRERLSAATEPVNALRFRINVGRCPSRPSRRRHRPRKGATAQCRMRRCLGWSGRIPW